VNSNKNKQATAIQSAEGMIKMELPELVKAKREQILRAAAHYGASNVRIFGSVARGEAHPDSDLDLLVSMEQGRTLLDLIGLEQDLEETLGRKVDVVTEGGVNPHLRERILRDAVPL
jgi:predicted nucleotidyltransferase